MTLLTHIQRIYKLRKTSATRRSVKRSLYKQKLILINYKFEIKIYKINL